MKMTLPVGGLVRAERSTYANEPAQTTEIGDGALIP